MRAGYCIGLSGLALVFGCNGLQSAIAEGDTRAISLHHLHTGEDLTITYKINGRYDEAALQKLNYELRDWRRNETIRMDPRLIDLVWEAQRAVGATQPIQIVCGYRAPQTNAMLHRRSSGVAQFSQHTLGKAMDFYIPGVPLAKLRETGLKLERGGVGYYPTSGSPFVHLDVGGIRYWPRMSREQLVRIFPDEKTVYLPSDGRPLRNYALALAEVERRGGAPSQMSLAAARSVGAVQDDTGHGSGSNTLAKLFGFGSKDGDEEEEPEAAAPTPTASTAAAAAPHPTVVATVVFDKDAPVPLPRSKPGSYQVASADPSAGLPQQPQAASLAQQPTRAPIRPAQAASLVPHPGSPTPNDIINERGYWEGPENAPAAATPNTPASAEPRTGRFVAVAAGAADAMRRAITMRRAYADTAPVDPETTATVRAETSNLVFAYAAEPGAPEVGSFGHATAVADGSASRTTANQLTAAKVTTSADTTIAAKNSVASPASGSNAAALREAVRSGERFEEPWLRSMVVAPDLRAFLTTALLGPLDYGSLNAFMVKPGSAVKMTFGPDPSFGLAADHFSGDAVVFISTMTFVQRTASLQ